jgi:hypothetical protein
VRHISVTFSLDWTPAAENSLVIALGVAGTVSTFSLLRAVSSNEFSAKALRSALRHMP